MGYSMNDLNNAAQSIEDGINERSQQKGEELADKIINGNLIGYIFARWFNFLTIFAAIGVVLQNVFSLSDGLSMLISFVATIIIIRQDFFWYMYFKHALLLFIALFILAMSIDKII